MTQSPELDVLTLLEKIIAANSPVSLAILILGLVIWIAGGNLLFSYHSRRVGNNSSFSIPFKNFNRTEWIIFLGLLLTGFASIFVALLINEK